MNRKYDHSDIDAMTERYLADRNDKEAISFLKDAATESEESRMRIRRNMELWFASAAAGGDAHFNTDAAFARFSKRTAGMRNTRNGILARIGTGRMIKAAAAVALVAALPWMGYRYATYMEQGRLALVSVTTPKGSISQLTLPDGSKVWLNAGSTIEYQQNFGSANRDVKLTGEACFDVKKNEELPFCVNTKSADLKVLGTKFTFRDYPEDKTTTVQLIRGHVDIASRKTGMHLDMRKNEMMVLDKTTGTMTKHNADMRNSDAWIRGELFFDEVPLEQIAKVLERTYRVKINVAPQLENKTFYISFNSAGMTIDKVLHTIAETQRMKYRKTGDTRYYLY